MLKGDLMNALEMISITKDFPGVRALDNVTFSVRKGEIHALCGENGAGKSTLMKILSGVYPAGTYEGKIIINGQEKRFYGIKDSEAAGISIIHQELALVKQMTIGENIFLGNEPRKNGVIDWELLYAITKKWLDEVGLNVEPDTKVEKLGIGQQQLVEIAKALSKNSDIIILDEPTAALTANEVDTLMNILRRLRNQGVTCIYISHKLNEVLSIADTITVLRDGKTVSTEPKDRLTEERIISLMVGRTPTERFPYESRVLGPKILEVQKYSVIDPYTRKKIIDNVSFSLHKGEILGIAGLMGAGRTELFTSLIGLFGGETRGEIVLEGKTVKIKSPQDAIRHGIAYVSEDRKRFGLVLDMDILQNTTLAALKKVMRRGVIDETQEIRETEYYYKKMKLKAPGLKAKVRQLSGGNQQKVVLAKWLMTEPKILFLDEPTRGIDVGAKYELYKLIIDLATEGVAVVLISSELTEVLGMADRILVMANGRIVGEFLRHEATQEKIMACATGG